MLANKPFIVLIRSLPLQQRGYLIKSPHFWPTLNTLPHIIHTDVYPW